MILDFGNNSLYLVRRNGTKESETGYTRSHKYLELDCEDTPHHRIWFFRLGKFVVMLNRHYKVARWVVQRTASDNPNKPRKQTDGNVTYVDFKRRA